MSTRPSQHPPADSHASVPSVEVHRSSRTGWLRAAVLGSNDAIVSTASLMVGVAATATSRSGILVAGIAGLVAGSMSMAVGEYVSVSSQRDTQNADIEIEKHELRVAADTELQELAGIYRRRGLDADLAMKVAVQLSAKDRLKAHLRDELGIDVSSVFKPFQAAWISAISFAVFALIPIVALVVAPVAWRTIVIAGCSIASLATLGALGAHLGGAALGPAVARVTIGGAFAMGVAAGVGKLLGVTVG